jgi:hypothetical protein
MLIWKKMRVALFTDENESESELDRSPWRMLNRFTSCAHNTIAPASIEHNNLTSIHEGTTPCA